MEETVVREKYQGKKAGMGDLVIGPSEREMKRAKQGQILIQAVFSKRKIQQHMLLNILSYYISRRGVMVNVLDCDIVVSELELSSYS